MNLQPLSVYHRADCGSDGPRPSLCPLEAESDAIMSLRVSGDVNTAVLAGKPKINFFFKSQAFQHRGEMWGLLDPRSLCKEDPLLQGMFTFFRIGIKVIKKQKIKKGKCKSNKNMKNKMFLKCPDPRLLTRRSERIRRLRLHI